jgi:hypothetical protein
MTQSQFRILVSVSLLIGAISSALDLLVPSLLPDHFHRPQADYDEVADGLSPGLGLLFAIPAICLALAGTYGLYFFRKWAPRVALAATALTLLAVALFGPTVQSGLGASLGYLSSYLWGASVLLPYLPQYSAWFQGAVATKSSDV